MKTFPLRPAPRKILLPRGYRLAAAAKFLLPRAAYKRYVEPVIADMQEESIQDILAGRKWHARWISVRGWLLVIPGWLYAFVTGKLAGLLGRNYDPQRADRESIEEVGRDAEI